jgi:putative colanic acid biosynthesis glycosyltransferase
MKILQINSHYNQSGAGKIVAAIHHYLKEQGHESRVAYGRGRETKESDINFISTKLSVYFSVFVNRFIGINGFTSWITTKNLLKEISSFKPDVIHLHGLHGYYINFKLLFDYINKNEIPIVWTFHDAHAFTGNCGYYKDCNKWENGCGGCPYLNDYPTTYLFDFTKWMWSKKKELFTMTDTKTIVSLYYNK